MFDDTGNPAIVDEWTFGQYQNPSDAQAALVRHWETWITEDDFKAIAAAGCVCAHCFAPFQIPDVLNGECVVLIFRLNHVRIPIGYWAYEVGPGEPFISGQHDYLRKAVTWAGQCNIKVIVDLHGVPGSQNGYTRSFFPCFSSVLMVFSIFQVR